MKTLTIHAKGDDVAEILLYDVIGADFFGEGVTAKGFREQVKAVKAKTINLRINSPGGSVFEGTAILATLDELKAKGKRVEVDVDGVAASAASVVAMAGNTIRMAGNALMMIHDPFAMVGGGSADMRRMADLLDTVKGQLLDAYGRRAKLSRDELAAAMEAETWYDGKQAVAAGLADSVGAPVAVAAFAGMEQGLAKFKYKHTPSLPQDAAAWAETKKRAALVAKLLGGT